MDGDIEQKSGVNPCAVRLVLFCAKNGVVADVPRAERQNCGSSLGHLGKH